MFPVSFVANIFILFVLRAPLELNRSVPGRTPLRSEKTSQTQDNSEEEDDPLVVPSPKGKRRASRASPVHSGAGKSPSPPRGPTASEGNTAPEPEDHRAEGDFSLPPETENSGAGNMGAGTDQAGRSEPLVVPPVLEKTTEAPTASPKKTSSSAVPEGSKPASPAKGSSAAPPASSKKPPTAPPAKKVSSRKGTTVTAEQLSGALQATVGQATSSRALTLHTSRAAASIGEKISAQTGRITELNRGEANLGSLQRYADKWNISDITEATLGLGKDGLPVVDARGPKNTVQHMHRLKKCMREFDNAWYDVDKNVLVSLFPRFKF